jgi:GNAT superfamily N-acetyltransferase
MSTTRSILIEPYAIADREACLRVFDSNTPGFFAPEERATFAAFLDAPPGPFWVARVAGTGAVVGCGGVSLAPDGSAWLRWGMVDGGSHRRGLGRQLLAARLGWIATQPGATTIRVATSAAASGFFQRLGFALLRVTADAYGPRLDRHDLVLPAEAPWHACAE